ncbi:MAG: chromate transporter [Treponema sp.]|nr:chromate transporter [Treponema sp.]
MTDTTVSLPFLFCIFFYVGLITIGGGLVAITIMQEVLVEHFHLVTNELFYNMVAISESTPGPMGVNMATYVGTELYGVGGGIVTTLGQVLPSIICILIIARFFSRFQNKAGVKAAFSTLRPAVTGIIAVAAAKVFILALLFVPAGTVSVFAEPETWKHLLIVPNALFYLLACFVLFKTKVHPIFVVAAGAVFGVLFC